MDAPPDLQDAFRSLSTARLASAAARLGIALQVAPPGLQPVLPGTRLAGPVRPARHMGTGEVLAEALQEAPAGAVLVVDDRGRLDEACVGPELARLAQAAGLAGILVWGAHRDSAALREIGLPVFSYGASPLPPRGRRPRRGDALRTAQVGRFLVDASWVVFADEDGALFLPGDRAGELLAAARAEA